jgi:hypothetical protein
LHNGSSFLFDSGAFVELSVNPQMERIEAPLTLSPNAAPVSSGRYAWNEYMVWLSDLFVVYNEQQFRDRPDLVPGRSVILKFTHMLQF